MVLIVFFFVWSLCPTSLLCFKFLDSFLQIIQISLEFLIAFFYAQVYHTKNEGGYCTNHQNSHEKFDYFTWLVRILYLTLRVDFKSYANTRTACLSVKSSVKVLKENVSQNPCVLQRLILSRTHLTGNSKLAGHLASRFICSLNEILRGWNFKVFSPISKA